MSARPLPEKFLVAFSFAGEQRELVQSIAKAVEERLGAGTVFLDQWYEHYLAGDDADLKLQEIYGTQCALAVVCVSKPYGSKPWTKAEHRAIRARRMQADESPDARDRNSVLPIRVGDGEVLGIPFTVFVPDVRERSAEEAAQLIIDRLRLIVPGLEIDPRRAAAEVCPYRGLEVFREEDAPFFFGRETFTEKLRKAVTAQSLVAVVGRSGSGKSSVVRAGLVPRLRRPDGETVWEVVTLVPGDRPLYNLSSALLPLLDPELSERRRLGEVRELEEDFAHARLELRDVVDRVLEKQQGTDRLLLVVDQWEELYTHRPPEEKAAAEHASQVNRFIDALLATTESAPLTLIVTLRADFYAEALRHGRLADALPQAQVNLRQMAREELERAIIEPAQKVGLAFDTGLVDRLLDDVGEEPGNLPLMEFALKALWKARQGTWLRYDVYTDMGGVKGAIAERAESLYRRLDEERQKVAEKVFTALVRPGEETGDTRRRAPVDELDDAGQDLVRTLAGPDARLLVTGRDAVTDRESVEVAHEALLREWPRLREWIAARREALRLRDKVADESRTWVREDRPDARRWRHELLDRARRLLAEAGLLAAMERKRDLADFLTPEAEWVLAELLCSGTDHARREAIGMRLSEIGDPRPGIVVTSDTLDIDWLDIPGGEIELKDRAGKARVVPFRMSRYLVTNAQFQAFVDVADGYANRNWWTDMPKDASNGPKKPWWSEPNRPREVVSWYEAVAFSRWLSQCTEFEVRLPTEYEWQQAATGGDPIHVYPWGREWDSRHCNTLASRLNRTTAVGMFPTGASAQGVLDLSGNLSEWCLNKHGTPGNNAIDDSDEPRALRGGSWFSGQKDHPRADGRSNRSKADPSERNARYGFRVVCAFPIG